MEGCGVGETGGAHWFSGADTNSQVDNAAIVAAAAEGQIKVTSTFTVQSSGRIRTEWEVDATSALPAPLVAGLLPSLPRVGLHALVPNNLNTVTWYGLGPHECYPDRKASARLQQHKM